MKVNMSLSRKKSSRKPCCNPKKYITEVYKFMKMINKIKKAFTIYCALVLVITLSLSPAYATNDPLQVVNNLSDFIFGLIRAIGLILLGFGIVQIGLSLKSHDPSQRANGFLTLAGGVIITFTKEILTLITGG